jgi:hypothetical protein
MPTITALADRPDDDPFERCADCHLTMPERSPTSPAIRRCERCWWAHNRRLYDAGDIDAVDPLALGYLQRHGGGPGTVTAPR